MLKASVCIQTYNHEPFIAQALDSVLMQETEFDYEIIVGEDESQDGTRSICMDYAERNPDRIRLFLRSRKDVIYVNGRPTGRFNFVQNLKAARGQYVALLDGDDYWTDPHKLQKQVGALEAHPECVLSQHDAMVVDECGRTIKGSMLPPHLKRDLSADELIRGAWVLTLTACFRNIMLDYPPEFLRVFNGDAFLFSLLGNFGGSKYVGHSTLPAAYRSHRGGVWSAMSDDWQRAIHQLTKYYWLRAYYARLGKHEYSQHFAHAFSHWATEYGLLDPDEVESRLSEHLLLLETALARENCTPEERVSMQACFFANLYARAGLAVLASGCWEQGRGYLARAIELDPVAWHDGKYLETVLASQGLALAGTSDGLDLGRLYNFAEGIEKHLPAVCHWPRRLVRRVVGRLYAEAAYRCHLDQDRRETRRYTGRALWANPVLLRDVGMLRRALGV